MSRSEQLLPYASALFRELRESKTMSRQEVVDSSGVTRGSLARFEGGKGWMRTDNLIKALSSMGVEASRFFKDVERTAKEEANS